MAKRRAQGPDLFTPRCETCDRSMIRTESGFLVCPMGHGKLASEARHGEGDAPDTCGLYGSETDVVGGL